MPFPTSWPPARWTPAGRSAAALGAAFAGVALLVWILTTPALLVHVNWDAGSYLHGIASGTLDWSGPPWNAHFALHYLYLLAGWAVRPFGGTAADGFRLLDALCTAAIFVLLLHACLKLTGRWLIAWLCAAAWLTAFVTLFLVFTLEDNLVYLVPAAGLVWLCATRNAVWSWREALAAGACAAGAALISVQGVLYVAPAIYMTVVLRPREVGVPRRLLEGGLVLGGLAATFVLCLLLLAATSRLSLGELGGILLSRPQPSQFPRSAAELARLLTDLGGALRTLGLAASFHLFGNRVPLAGPGALKAMGALFLAGAAIAWATTAVLAWRRRHWAPHVLASTLLLFVVLTALYRDVEYAYLKRTDFIPLLLAPLAASLLAALRPGRARHGAAAALGVLVLYQAVTALAWRHAEVRGYPTLDKTVIGGPTPGYHGLPDGSYLHHFRAIRQSRPDACEYLFDASEVVHGRWNPDVTGSLWSELPSHRVIGEPFELAGWRRSVRVISPAAARAAPACAWRSEAARRRLGGP